MQTNPAERTCPTGADYATWAEAKARDVRTGICNRAVTDLAPYFDKNPTNLPFAKGMAMQAILSLLPEAEADWFSAADIISLSLTASDLLKDAATLDMPPAMKLRFVGRAIQASKEARAIEATLQKRRKERDAMHPEHVRRIRDPLGLAGKEPPHVPDAEAEAAFAEMEAGIIRQFEESRRPPAEAGTPEPEPTHAEAEPAAAPCADASAEPLPDSETASFEAMSALAPWLTAKGPDGQPVNPADYLAAELKRQIRQAKPQSPRNHAYAGGQRRTG